ncbi:hypothetical protein [Streptomyces sp. A1499]|uniref:hypothetical protein n=1 Tax=Streptomyces sp. A1499 TaxID=2563104 RepID=UPI00109E7439|nr:hypothetical protein [Streptomyces sp. A1499]THC44017.1 hypothetical protein E7X58_33500 [Streptomyces sp. A1499]
MEQPNGDAAAGRDAGSGGGTGRDPGGRDLGGRDVAAGGPGGRDLAAGGAGGRAAEGRTAENRTAGGEDAHPGGVPATYGKDRLGALAAWPDDRLATSLYECGVAGLGRTAGAGALGTLLRTFPDSRQAGEVGPALRAAVTSREAALKGSAPCTAVDELRAIGATADALPAGKVDGEALRGSADRAVRRGVYTCGVDEFEDGRFTEAAETLNGFAEDYPADKRHDRAEDIAVAAEIAAERPSAGRRLPPSRPGGGGEVELVLANLGPGELEVLYTGPTTGTVELKACASCRTYPTRSAGDKACRAGTSKYPRTTLRLPAGDYHFLYKRATVRNRADGATLSTAYRYTDCSFVTRGTAGLGLT